MRSELNFPRESDGRQAPFLKGPIDWGWLTRAASLPGRCLHVAIALWFRSGLTKSRSVQVSNSLLKTLGVSRWSKYRALLRLSEAGLVQLDRDDNGSPVVTLVGIGSDDFWETRP